MINTFPANRLLADFSLWSANLGNLEWEIRRAQPFADLFHFDVADGQFAPEFLFFPDLIAALRPVTARPFHVHLMIENPSRHIEPFVQAGADIVTVHVEADDCPAAVEKIAAAGKVAGIAVQLETPLEAVLPYLARVGVIVIMGTKLGIKGVGLSEQACPRIAALRDILAARNLSGAIKISADGGIRENTVAALYAAGADMITPGSLVFRSPDLFETITWIRGLRR